MALSTDIPDSLKKLLGANPTAQPGAGETTSAPVGFDPSGVRMGARPAAGAPVAPAMPAAPAPQPQRVPAAAGMPSDDPANLPPMPTAPDYSNSPVAGDVQRYQDLAQRYSALKAPQPSDYKPKWWQRALAPAVGALAGREAGPAVDTMLHGRYYQAQKDYEAKAAPLEKQLQYEREVGIPLAEAQARIPQQKFENDVRLGELANSRATVSGRLARWDEQKDKFVGGTEREDQNSPTGWTAQTFGGDWKPFTPKSATALPKEPKTWQDAQSQASAAAAAGNKAEADRLSALSKKMYQDELGLHRAEKSPESNPNGWTPDESREITSRTRRHQTRIQELEKQRAALVGATDPQGQAQLSAINEELEGKDGKGGLYGDVDKIEQEVLGRRKGGGPYADKTPDFPKGFFKGKEGKRVTVDVGGGRKLKFDIQADGTPKPVQSGQ